MMYDTYETMGKQFDTKKGAVAEHGYQHEAEMGAWTEQLNADLINRKKHKYLCLKIDNTSHPPKPMSWISQSDTPRHLDFKCRKCQLETKFRC